MKQTLTSKGKLITGDTVAPAACDNLPREFLSDFTPRIDQADTLLVMTCAYGVQSIARQLKKCVVPASSVKPVASAR
jgi:hypothetical protein